MAVVALVLAILPLIIFGSVAGDSPGTMSPAVVGVAKLMALDGGEGDRFGTVAFDGTTAVIGALGDDDRGNDSGAVHVFVRTGAIWSVEAKLLASDGADSDGFGVPSVDSDVAVVGAPGDEAGKGAAYVFRRNRGGWSQEAKLMSSDGSANDQFGSSVAIDGDMIVIGARGFQNRTGAAYVFVREGVVWRQEARLDPGDGLPGDLFGTVSFHLDTAVIGAEGHGHERGAAYVFVRSDTGWSLQAKLTASDGVVEDEFGASVSFDNRTAVIGAPFAEGAGINCCKGAAYVFVREGTAWSEQARLTPYDAEPQDRFGVGLAVAGDFAMIGARDDDRGLNAGAAYLFERSGTTWAQAAKVLSWDGRPLDGFGGSLAMSAGIAVIGAPNHDHLGPDSGAAYVLDVSRGPRVASAPQNLRLSATADRVVLSWQAPSSDGGATVDAYRIFRGIAPGEAAYIISVSSDPVKGVQLHFDTGLVEGVTYYYQVSAVNEAGEGPRSDEVAIIYLGDVTNPAVMIVSPRAGSILTPAPVIVSGTASDDVGVERVEISADASHWIEAAGTTSWSGNVTLYEGSRTIFVRAWDTSGNVGLASIEVSVQLGSAGGLPAWTPFAVAAVLIAMAEAAFGFLWGRRRTRIRPPSP
jgi:FG-GAP repeat/Fibronectin type III domain/Bacterial Ig domain